MTGDFIGADAMIANTPLDCYDCLRMRGRISAAEKNWLPAEHWFDLATHAGPSLPFAWTDWGRMRLAAGDVAGAIEALQIAHQKGPRFADPLELWGEALLAGRDYAGAAGKFAEAARYAPVWGHDRLLWGEALMLSGRYREARVQYEAADGLDLSRPDRAALRVLIARTASGDLHG
jgi:tetratricopeptide (TPR) repeat protein